MKNRDRDRVVEVAGRARAFAAMDGKFAKAGEAGDAILNAYHAGEDVGAGQVKALCSAFHSTGLYAGCGSDTQKRLKAVYAVGAFDESKHKRDGGKFSTQEGAGGESASDGPPGGKFAQPGAPPPPSVADASDEDLVQLQELHIERYKRNPAAREKIKGEIQEVKKEMERRAGMAQASAAGPVTTEHVRKRDE